MSDSIPGRGFTVRRATIDDALSIRNVHVQSIRKLCAADYTPAEIAGWTDLRTAAAYRKAMADGGECMFVAESDIEDRRSRGRHESRIAGIEVISAKRRIVGFSSCKADEVCAVYVHPKWVRTGVGAALLAAVEQHMKENGISLARLHATITAKNFYVRHGWQNLGETVFQLQCGVGIACFGMIKDLN